MYKIFFVSPILFLTACSGSAVSTSSGFSSVDYFDYVSVPFEESISDDTVEKKNVGLVAYSVRFNPEYSINTVGAFAGIQDNPNVGPAVTTSTAVYSAKYGYTVGENIRVVEVNNDLYNVVDSIDESGYIPLTADFTNGTISGKSKKLEVDATISSQSINGSVIVKYDDPRYTDRASGVIEGQIGETGVIAAYHGKDDNTVFAGGLVGTPK